MLGNFTYCNPTRLHFGENALDQLATELGNYGPNILFVYGGGSIKRSGLYEQIRDILSRCEKNVLEVPGVMPNPTVEKLYEGCEAAKAHCADLIFAVGGGSVCDYAKAVSVSAFCKEDPWEKYYLRMEDVDNPIIPVGCVLTMVGTGSEMNAGSVITNHQQKRKIGHVFQSNVMPKFTILNPAYTFTVPMKQMVAGIYDAFNHICEQYFSGHDDNTTDYIAEGLMRSLIVSSRAALKDPHNYEARSNIMWAATWALNTLLAMGKATDWEVHMIGQSIGAYTDATHGMTLSAVSMAYYRYILQAGRSKFARFATNVWAIPAQGKSEQELAEAGLDAMEHWMRELGVAMNIRQLGVTEDMLEGIAEGTFLMQGGYRPLTRDDVLKILKASM